MDVKYEAIVVLGMALDEQDQLNQLAQARVILAVDYYHKYRCPVVVSGGGLTKKSEAQAMKEYLQILQVPQKDIFMEDESMETIGNAYFVKKNFIDNYKWKHIIVITSNFHIARAQQIFSNVIGKGINITFVGAKDCVCEEQKKQLYSLEKIFLEKLSFCWNSKEPQKRSSYFREL
ncbi:YdcF family protein [Candidatus Uabimicrobium sp. HlEnr_7]|uniref:YdcF family protein n=1 Tax=Candidatus Uabimicrobium helgolandensis TaxID=3095367 RepID=UPI0035577D7A